jgi:hypothetical protein
MPDDMMTPFPQSLRLTVFLIVALGSVSMPAAADAQPTFLAAPRESPVDVISAYLRALHARDARSAYHYISALDRNLRDEKTYLRAEKNFTGFALDLAKRLAAHIEVWVIEHKLGATKASYDIGYRMPTGDEIASQLHDWDADKLNSLSPSEQTALLDALDQVKKRGKMILMEGRERFDLVSEKDGWKIFLDWRSRHPVVVKTTNKTATELTVKFLRNDFLVKNDEPFQVDFKVTNRRDRDVVVKLNHRFEPRRMEKNVDMIACGSLSPVSLRPGETQNISSVYLLRRGIPEKSRLSILYDFVAEPDTAGKRNPL